MNVVKELSRPIPVLVPKKWDFTKSAWFWYTLGGLYGNPGPRNPSSKRKFAQIWAVGADGLRKNIIFNHTQSDIKIIPLINPDYEINKNHSPELWFFLLLSQSSGLIYVPTGTNQSQKSKSRYKIRVKIITNYSFEFGLRMIQISGYES